MFCHDFFYYLYTLDFSRIHTLVGKLSGHDYKCLSGQVTFECCVRMVVSRECLLNILGVPLLFKVFCGLDEFLLCYCYLNFKNIVGEKIYEENKDVCVGSEHGCILLCRLEMERKISPRWCLIIIDWGGKQLDCGNLSRMVMEKK